VLPIQTTFQDIGQRLTTIYGPGEDPGQPPAIALPLGGRIDDATVNEINAAATSLDPYKIEELVGSCLSRIANCVSIRDRAYEIQLRALTEGIRLAYAAEEVEDEAAVEAAINPGPAGAPFANARRDLKALKLARIKAQKDISLMPGSGANYGERFAFLKSMFKESFLGAVARAKLINSSVNAVYGIAPPTFPLLTDSRYLDSLALWAQKISDLLDEERDGRVRRQLIIPLTPRDAASVGDSVMDIITYQGGYAGAAINFKLTDEYFKDRGLKSPLMRSVAVRADVSDTWAGAVFSTWITPPQPTLVADDRTIYHASVGGRLEDASRASIEVHNLNPIGTWSLKITGKEIRGQAFSSATDLTNFFIHLTVFARRT
jgi:hypothetical protein